MRFTLKTLLTTIAVAAVLCCIFFTLPAIAAIFLLGVLWLLAPPALIAGIVYGRGYGRAFAIGCVATGGLFPVIWLYASFAFASVLTDLNSLVVNDEAALYIKLGFGGMSLLMGLSGLTSMTVRWLSLRMAPTTPVAIPASPSYAVLQRRITTMPTNPASPEDDGPDSTRREF